MLANLLSLMLCLVNLGCLTGKEPGITRDSIDIDWEYKNHDIKLVDTAGMRRKSNITQNLEQLSVGSTLRSIKYANTVVLDDGCYMFPRGTRSCNS
jgi:predicted GTPase